MIKFDIIFVVHKKSNTKFSKRIILKTIQLFIFFYVNITHPVVIFMYNFQNIIKNEIINNNSSNNNKKKSPTKYQHIIDQK